MSNTLKEILWNKEELLEKVKDFRNLSAISSRNSLEKQVEPIGKEVFLNTEEGQVRVLTYNMEKEDKLPLYVDIHGGGFVLGNAEMDDPFMMNIALKAKVKVINIDYSLAPEFPFPKALEECYAVIKYVKEHCEEFGIDPEKIAVGGHSAGGNISAALCLFDKERQLLNFKGLILDYPALDIFTDTGLKPQPKGSLPISMCRLFDACYCNDKDKRKNPLISPIYASYEDLRNFPPTLIITAAHDSLCKEAEVFRDKLMESGVRVTHKRFDAKHGFNLTKGLAADESWQMIIDHLIRTL